MNVQSVNVLPGQRVITAAGVVATVAMVRDDGTVLAWYSGSGVPRLARVRGDAWGGEHDGAVCNAG
jgi:methyl coenzyme M reductase subunit C